MTEGRRNTASGDNLALVLIGLIAAALLLLSLWLVDRSGPDPYYKGPLVYPQLVLGMIVLAALRPAVAVIRNGVDLGGWRMMPRRSFAVFVLMCFFPALIGAVGLALASLFVVFWGLVIAGQTARLAAFVGIGVSAVLWLMFRGLLDIWFPSPWLLEPLGF